VSILEKIKLADLKVNTRNPRRISEFQFDNLKNSIDEFGFIDPIIINSKTKMIIGGHQRYKVLTEKNIEEGYILNLGDISWVFTDDDLEVVDDNYEKAMNISLNKISGEWDNNKLKHLNIDLSELLDDYEEELETISIEEEVDEQPEIEEFRKSYTIVFENYNEFDEWLRIIDYIIRKYPDLNSPVEKILKFIEDEVL